MNPFIGFSIKDCNNGGAFLVYDNGEGVACNFSYESGPVDKLCGVSNGTLSLPFLICKPSPIRKHCLRNNTSNSGYSQSRGELYQVRIPDGSTIFSPANRLKEDVP